ncbi:ABC transporter permease [Patescibacteria group bacterium]|nr:ABC transporter permease [Patescibacteria group bacterium]MBU4016403.1 ABC transporter permease [Patescibacteria group bacterium]MBU4099292.1 ABC transporter permease [Patescibacteria group bacterium]
MIQALKIAIFLAYKSIIRGNRAVSVLMIFILSLAFINLIFISAILDGVLEAINKQIINNIVSNIVINPQDVPSKRLYIPQARNIMEQIESIPGIATTARHYTTSGTIYFDKDKNGKTKDLSGAITGIDPEKERKISKISQYIAEGEYLEKTDTDKILIGAGLAGGYEEAEEIENLGGVKAGDTVRVAYNNGIVREYKVKGIFLTKFMDADRMAFVTTKEAESILSVSDKASQILVKTDRDGDEDKYLSQINSVNPDLKVKTWNEYMGPMKSVATSFDIIILIITTIGIVVAAITIFILIYVNVVNKRRQIGILKAIGIKEKVIVISYIFQALFHAVLGIIIGLILTLYLLVPYFIANPLIMPVGDVSLSMDMSRIISGVVSLFIAALIAGFIPSYLAARENILKAIWGA